MSAVLVPSVGTLVVVRNPGDAPAPGILKLSDGFPQNVLVISYTHDARVLSASLPTIGGPEYLYVFGDALHDISIGVVMYPSECSGQSSKESDAFKNTWGFYMNNRASTTGVKKLTITFAGVTFFGILLGFRIDTESSSGFGVIKATLTLRGWVSKSTTASGVSSTSASSSSAVTSGSASPKDTNTYMVPGNPPTYVNAAVTDKREYAGKSFVTVGPANQVTF